MSVVIIPTPGTAGGPCRGSCDHAKCHTLRALADERCHHCGVRFGFGTRITGEPALHLRCAQAIAARNGAPATHPINDPTVSPHFTGQRGDKS
jgi:hypothetical protein